MATFESILRKTLGHEGFYANDPSDRGGETYMGISRRYNPDWNGWSLIDEEKKRLGVSKLPTNYKIKNEEVENRAKQFYKKRFWDNFNLDKVKNANVAQYLFDWSMGSGGAGNEVRKILQNKYGISTNGKGMGYTKEEIEKINQLNPDEFLKDLNQSRVQYYQKISNYGDNKKFLKGWLRRANSGLNFDFTDQMEDVPEEPDYLKYDFTDPNAYKKIFEDVDNFNPLDEDQAFVKELIKFKYY